MTRSEALEYFMEELKDGKCSDTCPICNAMEWAMKALEEPTLTTAGEPMTFGVTGIEPIWHPYPEEKPKEAGEYLVAQDCEGAIYYSIASFGKSLWLEKSQRNIKAKKHGRYWYKYDSEWGDYTCDNVIAWMPIPKYEKEKDNG